MKFHNTRRGLLAAFLALTLAGEIASAQTTVTVLDPAFGSLGVNVNAASGAGNVGTNWLSSQENSSVFVSGINALYFTNSSGTAVIPVTGSGTNFLIENVAVIAGTTTPGTLGYAPGCFAYCWQDVGALLPNTTYTLTVAAGQTLVGLTNAAIATGQGYIALINGKNALQTPLGTTFVDNSLVTPNTFADYTLTVTTPSVVSGDLTIAMVATNGANGSITGGQICFDNVRLTRVAAADPVAIQPAILSPVTPLAQYAGAVVTLSEAPAGTGPFTYHWQTDSGSGGVTFTSISLATNATLVVTNVASTTVEYRVIVTNHLGSIATSTPLTVAVAPPTPPSLAQDTLPSQIASDLVGDTVTFSVVAAGDQPITYQWQAYYGGGTGNGTITGTSANGTTNSTLILTNLQVSDAGTYVCQISNDQSFTVGTTFSTGTTLIVNPLPSPNSYGIIEGDAVQYGTGSNNAFAPNVQFTPSWPVASGSLIQGFLPFATSTGNFKLEGCAGTNALTTGVIAPINSIGGGDLGLATIGNPAVGGGGSLVTYRLPTNAYGWDITNVVVYGGWADGGRDQQSYDLYFASFASLTTFGTLLDEVNFKPAAPTYITDQTAPDNQIATRVTLTAATPGTAMAKNVGALEFNMNLQAGGFNANGWQGYAQIQVFGTASAPAPVFAQNMVPSTASDVLGSSVTMSCVANFTQGPLTYQWTALYADGHQGTAVSGSTTGTVPTGTAPAGTTSPSLTLNNLQMADIGTYTLLVYYNGGTLGLTSLPCVLTVNSAPTADALGVIDAPATQTGNGLLTPTWTVAPGSLIAGLSPTLLTPSLTSFTNNSGAGFPGISVLTDGSPGYIGGGNDTAMASAGSSAGTALTYTLPASSYGYNITSIVIYGGWNDAGRDEQEYEIYASGASTPTLFNQIIANDYRPPSELTQTAVPNMTRLTYTPAAGTYLAENVSQLYFDFAVQVGNTRTSGGENGWQGYSEIDVYGTAATAPVAALSFVTNMVPGAGSDVVGSSVTMYCAAVTPNPPLTYQWKADYGNGAGPVPVTGTTSGGINNSNLVLSNLQQSDTATYTLTVTDNAANSITSEPCAFAVNPVPAADAYGVLDLPASQQANFTTSFTPTWSAPPAGSLIAGMLPSALTGNNGQLSFTNAENGDAISNGLGLLVLTDDQVGYTESTFASPAMCIIGSGNSGGNTLTYTLPSNQGGYSITNIQIFGGWGNGNRDEQLYTIYYSTVAAPFVFTPFVSYDYRTPIFGNGDPLPNMTRMIYTSATPGASMAQNVAKIYINFTTNTVNANAPENGYQGYSEIAIYGTPSASAVFPPAVTTNTVPSVCQDVVGSSETFIAGFTSSAAMTYQWQVNKGSGPVNVSGAQFSGITSPVLTDNNVQAGDTGSYFCVATVGSGPAAGTATTTSNVFVVNPAPTASGNFLVANALQAWSNSTLAQTFTPTWTIPSGSLIAGTLPSSSAVRGTTGSFSEDGQGNSTSGGGGLPVLTDGFPGTYGDNTDTTLASCGSTMGSNIVYTLAGSTSGYNISSIITYGGWANNGRDEQAYTVLYSTAAAPTNFITLTANDYKPASILTTASGWNNFPDSSRSTITAVSGVLASNVYAIRFNFASPNGENNWEGYSEIQVFGTVSPPAPIVSVPFYSGGNLHWTGTGGTPGGGYTVLTSTNIAAPFSAWTTNSQSTFDGTGAFSLTIPVTTSEPARYFQIRVP